MITKLEICHLAPYLPYNLLLNLNRNNGMYVANRVNINKCEMRNLSTETFFMYDNVYYGLHDIKPILYPLSFLTKPILHEGKEVIVSEICYELSGQKMVYLTDLKRMFLHPQFVLDYPYWVVEILFKHHFNVFGLPESLFVDKSTIDK